MKLVSGWRLALRLAWRDAWRSKSRSVLVTHEARHAAWADRVVFLRDGIVVDESGSAPVEALLDGDAVR